jgi:hypothetical protein
MKTWLRHSGQNPIQNKTAVLPVTVMQNLIWKKEAGQQFSLSNQQTFPVKNRKYV